MTGLIDKHRICFSFLVLFFNSVLSHEPSQALELSQSASTPISPKTSRSDSPCPRKRQRAQAGSRSEVDDALLLLSRTALERRLLREKKKAEKEAAPKNPEINYGMEIAETLNRFTPRQKAVAKLRIRQVLFEVEFPPKV